MERKETKMEEMEVAENSIPRVLFQTWGERHKKIIVFVSVFFIVLVNYSLLVGFQSARYDVEKFNCVNFTRESMGFFKSIGVKSYPMYGVVKDNTDVAHSWVGIDFFGYTLNYEPQIYFFFLPEWRYIDVHVDTNFDNY
jgi:hypothetical protein